MAKARKTHGGKRTGAGRKPAADSAADVVVQTRTTRDLRDRMTAAAERERLTLSEWLRAAAELALARGSTR